MSTKARRTLLALATAVALAVAPMAIAQTAPPSESEATGANVGDAVTLSDTNSQADEDSSSSEANSVELGGEPPSDEFESNASAEESGDSDSEHSALIDTGENEDGRLQVAPSDAEAEHTGDTRTSSGEASTADANLGGEDGINAQAIHASSEASHTDAQSQSSAESELLDLMLGGSEGLHVELLHSSTSSSGEGSAYLVAINGNEIGSDEQFQESCNIEVPGLLNLICVQATGGEGSAVSTIADAAVGGDEGLKAVLFGTGSEGAAAVDQAADDLGVEPAPAPAGGEGTEVEGEVVDAEQGQALEPLPRTGFDNLFGTVVALVLIAAGVVARRRFQVAGLRPLPSNVH